MGSKKKYYFLFLLSYCTQDIVSSLHSRNFESTKAEDSDGSYTGENFNLSPSCDLTSKFCDINCCSDQDCSEQEKNSFKCVNKEYNEISKFSYLDCENLGSLNSFGNPLLCLHDQNSPYLGDFYEKDENFSSFSFSEILTARSKGITSFRITDLIDVRYKNTYKHGSNVFLMDMEEQYQYINIFSNVLSKGNGYCSKVPLKFFTDETSTCFFLLDEEQCLLNEEFHVQHHVNVLKKLELLGNINDVNITYNIVCLRDATGFVSVHRHVFHDMTFKNNHFLDITECENYATTELNKNKTICKNVVVGFNYTIFVNDTVITSIKATVFTVDIPLNIKEHNLVDKSKLNFLQAGKKNVIHKLLKTSAKFENADFVGNLKKNGYILGKPIHQR